MGSMTKTFYFLKNQDWLKFLKPAERAEIYAADRAYRESEEGRQVCRPFDFQSFIASRSNRVIGPEDFPTEEQLRDEITRINTGKAKR
jgi:hypothetical protein